MASLVVGGLWVYCFGVLLINGGDSLLFFVGMVVNSVGIELCGFGGLVWFARFVYDCGITW